MICNTCNEDKDLQDFRIRSGKPHLRHLQCRDCENIYHKEYNIQNPDTRYLSRTRWKINNNDKVREQDSKYRSTHKNEIRERAKKYRNLPSTKLKRLVYENNRRNKKVGFVSESEWQHIIDFYGNKCLCCLRDDVDLTQDHITPISVGGKHVGANLQPLCCWCNSKKRTKTIDYRPFPYMSMEVPNG